MKKILSLSVILLSLVIAIQAQDLTINTFANKTHSGAATHSEVFNFPADNSIYESIIMRIALTCPAGGCDPWDRFSSIKIVKDGQEYEIGRYITPYANNWCSWSLDVSDYRELLEGSVELESFIETWSNGWDLSLDFDFYLGTPEYTYIAVQSLMMDYQFEYGDTIFWSLDIPSSTLNVPDNVEKVIYRVANTGHGQGNTDNAAEFSPRTHEIVVNGVTAFTQDLWKSDCNVNPCSPQSGTWQFARAGWCPGQEVPPHDYDVTSMVTPEGTIELDYKLEPYFNLCSPWNPSCSNGITCSTCTYDNGAHTLPHYKISLQAIYKSSTPIEISTAIQPELAKADFKVYPNPSDNGIFNLSFPVFTKPTDLTLKVIDYTGRIAEQKSLSDLFGNAVQQLNLSHLPNGQYFIVVEGLGDPISKSVIVFNESK